MLDAEDNGGQRQYVEVRDTVVAVRALPPGWRMVHAPEGSEGCSHVDLEWRTCDVMLAGWVFRCSPLWKSLHRDVCWLIYRQLTRRLVSYDYDPSGCIIMNPRGLVRWRHAPDLNYARVLPRGIVASFEHGFLSHELGMFHWSRLHKDPIPETYKGIIITGKDAIPRRRPCRCFNREETRLRELHPYSPFQVFLGPPPPAFDPNAPSRQGRPRKHTERLPTEHDQSRRDARGRVICPVKGKRAQRQPRPSNVAWKKGRHTGQRHKGK